MDLGFLEEPSTHFSVFYMNLYNFDSKLRISQNLKQIVWERFLKGEIPTNGTRGTWLKRLLFCVSYMCMQKIMRSIEAEELEAKSEQREREMTVSDEEMARR